MTPDVVAYLSVMSISYALLNHPPIKTVPVAWTVPTGSGAGSLQVIAVSPDLAAGFELINTVALPLMMSALFCGGITKDPPEGRWGGWFVATLPRKAAGFDSMLTLVLRFELRMPEKECGTRTGDDGPGGWIKW